MESPPLVSVCVPTYNYARFLPDCIESVLEQSISDWELIICDDASVDDTENVVRRYAAHDPRIRYLRNTQRLGMNGNLKHAADCGTAKYLKILCADDWIAPNCLAVLCALMESYPSAAIATCAEIHTNAIGEAQRVQFLFGEPVTFIAGDEMLDRISRGEGGGGNSSFVIRAAAYHRVGGYDARRPYAGDYDLLARLCAVGDYVHTDQPLFYGRSQPDSSSARNPKLLLDVRDWYDVPATVFEPRHLGDRNWRRFTRRRRELTARYLLNILLEHCRGNHAYAQELRKIILAKGSLMLGIPWLVVHVPRRLYNRITGADKPLSRPVEAWMGTPSSLRLRRDRDRDA